MRWTRLAFALGALTCAPSAFGAFHFMKVVEVFPGTAAAPNAQYVVIQMYSGSQNFVSGHFIRVFNAANTPIATFTFGQNVANGQNQDKILIATPEAAAFFNVTANLAMTPVLPLAGGKVCFDAIPEDCMAWGNYAGGPSGVGTPFNASTGLLSGRASIRRLDVSGGATILEASDDTDNCASDFVIGLPAPRNNAGVNGTIPPATCGNNVIEGLEQCDDANTTSGDGCSSTCMIEPPPPTVILADGFEDP